MREQKFAEFLKNDLAFGVFQPQRHVFQGEALHGRAVVPALDERHERTDRLHDRVAQRCRHPVSVAGRAGQRVGAAAGCQNDCVRGDRAVRRFHAADRAVLHGNFRCPRVPHLYAGLAQIALQRGEDVGRAVGDREDAIAAFGLQRTAVSFKERPGVGRREARERAIEEAGFVGVFFKTSSHGQSFVTLQRPFPVMSSFLPRRSFGSSSVTAAPCSAAQPAAIIPAAPPPMTTTRLLDALIDVIFIPDVLQIFKGLRQEPLLAPPNRDDEGVDDAHRRDERVDH